MNRLTFLLGFCLCVGSCADRQAPVEGLEAADCWTGAGVNQIPVDSSGVLVRYGYELISNTAVYLGPRGTVARNTNGMNCQNCHLQAGAKPWGNNYGAVASTYPRFRARSGGMESIVKRVTDCFERSLNGIAPDTGSREMNAIVAYIQWLGKDVPKDSTPKGTGIMQLAYLDRPADPAKGKSVYTTHCQRCHGADGAGQWNAQQTAFVYPPLWGEHSYNDGAGLYRISRLAGFARNNMPDPRTYHNPLLSDEEAWDVAAFINSQPRPKKDTRKDWPDISKKPVDHPFGPYADGFSEQQHKYGPYTQMKGAAASKRTLH